LIVKSGGKSITSGPGKTNPTNTLSTIPLKAGWNLIGNPFNYAIPQNKVSLANSTALDIHSYTGSWQSFTGDLQPFDGYALYTENATNLLINPALNPVPNAVSPQKPNENVKYELVIKGSCQSAKDEDNKIMLITDADDNWDKHDRPEPPIIGDYLSIYFPHPEWKKNTSVFCVDARPELMDGGVWDFEVKTNIKDNVRLEFCNLEKAPDNYEIWIVNRNKKSAEQIDKNNNIVLVKNIAADGEKLTVLIGNENFIRERINDYGLIPDQFTLRQNYPNPFNPTTTIEYAIPEHGIVTMKIYNSIGQEVATLINNEEKSPGYHSVIWDGRNSSGFKVSSGFYIYRMISGDFIETKKMILLK
jgi:hypothetical protein